MTYMEYNFGCQKLIKLTFDSKFKARVHFSQLLLEGFTLWFHEDCVLYNVGLKSFYIFIPPRKCIFILFE
jgi:hypothetical protein